MKTKTWRNGTSLCRSYMKPVGNGWEVGFTTGSKLLFVGNFIHSSEATRWYAVMNREIHSFGRKFRVGKHYSHNFMWRALTNHLYSHYYRFLDQCFTRYNRTFQKAASQDVRRYRSSTRYSSPRERVPFLRAA